ncbi:MAG: LysM peptidoglycan-binding domain-containing protein [Burkholderiaceae bacterium]|nr:LysM peptidoglycan-binding domain-containing protein [Burkholderiaceae bacterium]
MKKSSTQILALAVALAATVGVNALAQQATPPLEITRDAPDRYTVVKGDTLWHISGRFLEKPWRWPEIWQLNREQIRNPHLIYPGDVVYLDRSGAEPRLRLGRRVGGGSSADASGAGAGGAGLPAERLQPRVRVEPLEREAVPTISSTDIESFLSRPLVVDEAGLKSHPRIVGTQEGRVNLGPGELAYVRGLPGQSSGDWHVYRSAKPLVDPDTRQTIAWEAMFVGTAKLERNGDPATMRIVATTEEIGVGDRLMPAERAFPVTYAPRPPEAAVKGRIVSVYRGVSQVGRNSVVALNLGKADGLEVGHVLAVNERGRTVTDREAAKPEKIALPDRPVGHLLVFRVFDKIAYGLVMEASASISVGDAVSNPR